jgi:putative ABC transport system permease protein
MPAPSGATARWSPPSWPTANGRITYRDKSIDQTQIRGVTAEYVNFSSFDAERGRLISPIEIDTNRPVTVIGWQTADRLFGDLDPLEKTIQIEGVHFRVVGVSAKRGSPGGRRTNSGSSR